MQDNMWRDAYPEVEIEQPLTAKQREIRERIGKLKAGKLTCENCGVDSLNKAGQFIQHGQFAKCWVCTRACENELLQPVHLDGEILLKQHDN